MPSESKINANNGILICSYNLLAEWKADPRQSLMVKLAITAIGNNSFFRKCSFHGVKYNY